MPDTRGDPHFDEIADEFGPRYFDRLGNPITMREWMAGFHSMEYKIVAKDEIGPYEVSTVWLGLDHGFAFPPRDPGYKPIIFETMVFGSEPVWRPDIPPADLVADSGVIADIPRMPGYWYYPDFDQRRYRTEEAALAGHAEICREISLLVAANPDHQPDPEAGYPPYDAQDE